MSACSRSLLARLGLEGRPAALVNTLAYYAALVGFAFSAGAFGPTIPALAEQTGSALAAIGVALFTGSLGYLIGSTIISRVYDRLPGHPVMGVSLFVMAGCLALVPLAPSLALLAFLLGVIGVAQGMVNVGTNLLLLWIHGEKVSPFMNALHFFFGVGAFIAPVIVAQARLLGGGIGTAYWTLAVLVALIALRVITLRGSPGQVKIVKTDAVPRRVDYRLVVLLGGMLFFYVAAELAYGNWIYTYAVKMEIANEVDAAYLTSGFWVALTLGRLVAIPLSLRYTARWILTLAMIGTPIFLVSALAMPASLPVIWLATLGTGFCAAPIFPAVLMVANKELNLTAKLLGLMLLGDSLGAMTLPSLMGGIITAAGAPAMMAVILGFMILLAGTYIIFTRLTAKG